MKTENTLKRLLIAVAASLVTALVVQACVRAVFEPGIDNNTAAYLELNAGYRSANYAQFKLAAEHAEQMATDPELKSLAGFFTQTCGFCLKTGVQTFEEGSSFDGQLKALVSGIVNPELGIEGLALLAQDAFLDSDSLFKRMHAKYQVVYEASAAALAYSHVAFWLVLFGLAALIFWFPNLRRLVVSAVPRRNAARATSSTGEPHISLISCPHCGARNRNRVMSSGQSLVCGRCKTILLRVA